MKIESDNLRTFLKEVTPDGYKSESYEHGYTDAIIVVNTRLDLLEMQENAERQDGRVERVVKRRCIHCNRLKPISEMFCVYAGKSGTDYSCHDCMF